jgi:ppGpp synthetase/RelA/SpoT-type nucleotidyltranferase
VDPPTEIRADDAALIEAIVATYIERLETARRLSENLSRLFTSERLTLLVHSIKARAKDPSHLKDKLERKVRKCYETGDPFDITPDNLFERINDLAGVRLLHLHTSQFQRINQIVLELLADEGYKVLEGPIARTWDDEYKKLFDQMGVTTIASERMYTSVHYVVEPGAKTRRTAEIQVRTLAEELWGEVDHTINYPHPCSVASCKEQIKVLARVTSSCTRLVDSIFFALDSDTGKN